MRSKMGIAPEIVYTAVIELSKQQLVSREYGRYFRFEVVRDLRSGWRFGSVYRGLPIECLVETLLAIASRHNDIVSELLIVK